MKIKIALLMFVFTAFVFTLQTRAEETTTDLASEAPSPDQFVGIPHTCDSNYPTEAREANLSGTTQLHFTIGTDGYTSGISIVQSSGHEALDNAAIRCVKRWKYKPALKHGEPIAVGWTASVVWKAEDLADTCRHSYTGPPIDFSKIDGTTEVTTVAKWGKVTRAFVAHSSGDAALDAAAVGCVSTLHFPRDNPELRGNTKVPWKALLAPAE